MLHQLIEYTTPSCRKKCLSMPHLKPLIMHCIALKSLGATK
ncbi:hypothetical protein [Candidatus Symbiopectobacterium sp.]|nr:hypothetical protein [Candidatus Symbiopectobacterium sp.]